MANTENASLILGLLLGTFALLLMVMAIIAFVFVYQKRVITHQAQLKNKDEEMQRELLRATIQSQETEQKRIARDLHDDLGPMLSAVKLKMSQIKKQMEASSLNVSEVDTSKSMLDQTIQQVRNLSHQLLPPLLEDYGLAQALESTLSKMSNDKIHIQFVQGTYSRLAMEVELTLYRVIMEVVNNAVKHSYGSLIEVDLEQAADKTTIAITDNGKGFDINLLTKSKGLGFKNIQSRLSTINSTVNYQSSTTGTVATISVYPKQ